MLQLCLVAAAVRREQPIMQVPVDSFAELSTVRSEDLSSLDEDLGMKRDLCDMNLFVSYKGGWKSRSMAYAEGMWKLDAGEWSRQLLIAKKSKTDEDGECTRTYTAVCSEGVIEVKKTCEKSCQGEDECVETRGLTRTLGNWIKSSGSDLKVGKKG